MITTHSHITGIYLNLKDAYNKWLCSATIPYYDKDKLVKPCLRYCYNVQNLCPFFRPVDMYGGQPVFHCRNVIQVNEWRQDGYEDDDENYYDDNLLDEDTCYGECQENVNEKNPIKIDVSQLFNERIPSLLKRMNEMSEKVPLIQTWVQIRSNLSAKSGDIDAGGLLDKLNNPNTTSEKLDKNETDFNLKGRFLRNEECLYNIFVATPQTNSTSTSLTSNKLSILFYFILISLLL